MTTWQLFLDDNYTRSDTSTGSAGTTTGAGNSWTDVQGGVYQISTNRLKATADAVDNSQYKRDFLTRPSGENQQDQRVLARTAATADTHAVYDVALRYQSSSKNCYLFAFDVGGNSNGGTIEIFKIVGGAATQLGSTVNVSPTRNLAHVYELQCSAVGVSPATLNFTLVDITAGTTVATYTQQTDSEATLQGSGMYALDVHSNPGGATFLYWGRTRLYQAITTPTVLPNDANLFLSPYNWYVSGSTYTQTQHAGAYLKMSFTGTELQLKVDVSPLTGGSVTSTSYPKIRYSIDNATFTDVQLTSSSSVLSLGTDLGSSTHTLLLTVLAVDPNFDVWTTPANVVRLNGFFLDSGAAAQSQTLESKRLLVYGDSIICGEAKGGASPLIANSDSTMAFPFGLASALLAEYGAVGFGGQGWAVAPGGGNAPMFYNATNALESWDKYFSGTSRLVSSVLSPAPDYIVTVLGYNDANGAIADATVTAAVSGWLTAVRAAAPSAKIFIVIAVSGAKRSAVTSGFNNYQATPDTSAFLIDLGTDIQTGLLSSGSNSGTWQAPYDGVHPGSYVHAQIAGRLAQQIQSKLSGGTRAFAFS